jgi:pimeloyl-ACP methyl ester carboxylesterase
MGSDRFTVAAADGKQLEVLVSGPSGGVPLVFQHGTPGGLVPMPPLAAAAAARELRLVMYSRPGYGGSAARPGRAVADAAADVRAILDSIGAEQFVTAGWSGGGPHALACAALLPGRCLAAASVAGVAPFGAAGLAWLDGMAEENVAEFAAAGQGEPALTTFLEKESAGLALAGPADIAGALGGLVSAVDRAALTTEFAGFLAASFRAALRGGIAGWRDDDAAFVTDWGFGLDEAGPAAIWQGDQDRMVPCAHGAWLAARLPAARAHLLPGHGHLTLVTACWPEILDDLAGLAGLPRRAAAEPGS